MRTFIFLLLSGSVSAQVGGGSTFRFLDLVTSARVAAVGGNYLAIAGDSDINLACQNPSLINTGMHNKLALNYVNYFSDIGYGSFAYSRSFKNAGSFNFGIRYVDYGSFDETTPNADIIGQFTASESAIQLGWAKPLDSMFTFGANVKFVYSALGDYYSNGLATDLAMTWHQNEKELAVTAVVKNLGMQFKNYSADKQEGLPFELQLGVSKKLEHLPLRYIVNIVQLQQWDLTDPNLNDQTPAIDPLTGEVIEVKKRNGDKLMRHFVFGAEFSPSDNFNIRFGYNYRRRQELKLDSRVSTVGFSWGFGLRVSKFHVSYGRAAYHLAGASNHFSVTTGISEFVSKK